VTGPILVGLDAGRPSEEAEQLALTLARAAHADVLLCTVFPLIPVHTRHYERLLRREAEAFLARRAERLRPQVTSVATHAVGSYSAGHGLHRLARELGAGSVVLGPTRRGRAGRVVPGAMAARLAHGAPCPVAVAPEGYVATALETIGVAFTGTEDGREALKTAAALAASAGSVLRVVSVAAPLPWMDIIEPGFDGTTLETHYRRHVADQLDAAVAGLPDGLKVEAETVAGDPTELIAAATESLDLLVCGSRGYGALGTVAMGSVSHALLAVARCPLLIAPRHAPHPREEPAG
jgi:nucleotide-binding universal stress UspA family protein